MAPNDNVPTRFRSRFSLLSLLPARHPPLNISNPRPTIPQPQPPIETGAPSKYLPRHLAVAEISPVESSYATPLSAYSEESIPPSPPRPTPSPPRRHVSTSCNRRNKPPPLDLRRTNALYPVKPAKQIIIQGPPPTQSKTNSSTRSTNQSQYLGVGMNVKNNTSTSSLASTSTDVSRSRSTTPQYMVPKGKRPNPPRIDSSVMASGSRKVTPYPSTLPSTSTSIPTSTSSTTTSATQQSRSKSSKGIPIVQPPLLEEEEPEDDDPFAIAVVDIGHKYTSWKGGKVDIRPGEVIPSTYSSRNKNHNEEYNDQKNKHKQRQQYHKSLAPTIPSESYDSVLHDVLLTPTYLDTSPLPVDDYHHQGYYGSSEYLKPPHGESSSKGGSSSNRQDKRLTRYSRWIKGIFKEDDNDSKEEEETREAIRRLQAKEAAEMRKFRNLDEREYEVGNSHYPHLNSKTKSSRNSRVIRGVPNRRGGSGSNSPDSSDSERGYAGYDRRGNGRKSPVGKGPWVDAVTWGEARKGGAGEGDNHGWKDYRNPGKEGSKAGGEKGLVAWWLKRREDEKKRKEEMRLKRRKRIRIIFMVIAAILFALTIILCGILIPRSFNNNNSSNNSSSENKPTGTSTGTSASPPLSTSTSKSLQSCLDQYTSLTNPNNYPCSDCIPLLTSTVNDFASPLVNGNSTGVGSALQLCSLMDVFRNTGGGNSSGLVSGKWGVGRDVCTWGGVVCDNRGRVTELSMTYPNVPDKLPDTLGNIISLSALHLKGNSSIPSGNFPSTIVNPTLVTLDLQYTALTGPITSVDWSKASNLTSIYLANNANLGTDLPDLSKNGKITTLAVTGQSLKTMNADQLPGSITYLDLSFNSLPGQIPSFSQLTGLKTLFLQSNLFTTSPSSLPGSIVTLSLTGNTNLSGSMPANTCSNTNLSSCDLRSTNLGGTNAVSSSSSSASSSSGLITLPGLGMPTGVTTSSTSSSAMPSSTAKVCGVCRYS